MTVEQWLGEDNELGINIWKNKYRYGDETFDEWLDRVSGGDSAVKELIRDKKFLFGGRILSNRGLEKTGKKLSLSNCYVISPVEDNLESIFDCAKNLARTYSYGGGCGLDLSNLSPRGARINNASKETSGAVSFMDLYSLTTELIGQEGRRGALMLSLSCDHPDLEEFIELKSNLDKVNKANISVRVTDEFMKAVENKQTYKLRYERKETGEVIEKEVDAYAIFKKLCAMNWDYAEPGILFWDRIESHNMLSEDKEFKYAGVNPCFDGSMRLLTTDGYKTFDELEGQTPTIFNVDGNITKSKIWCSGEKDTVKIKFGTGEIICTPDHKFMTIDGEECMAKDLKGKTIMPQTKANRKFNERFVKYGFIQGDGQLSRFEGDIHKGLEVNIGEKDTDIYELFKNEEYTHKSHRAIYVNGFRDNVLRLGFSTETLPTRVFPKTYKEWTKHEKASFLHGCYSANGSVITAKSDGRYGRVSYKTTCRQFAEELVETLTSDFDIQGVYITTNKPKKVLFENGEYECRESYDINIGRLFEITKFISEINFYQHYKREKLARMMMNRGMYVVNVVPFEKRKVYDFTEPDRHWGIVEGVVAHNCAEEPLPAGGNCLLGSINLAEFVNSDKTFNYLDFQDTIRQAVKGLNDVLDEGIPLHPLEEQRESAKNYRQIGLGIMGLADMLIKMEIRYGGEEAKMLCKEVSFMMADIAISESGTLALRYDPYPKYNREVLSSDYIKKNTSVETKRIIDALGLRNSQILTIAPTGTLSTMLGISGGIEPIFATHYTRKTESLHNQDKYYKVYTPIVKEYIEQHNLTDETQLPEWFVTSQTLDFNERIEMQGVWQDHIDASISSTVNVPNDFTVEQTEELYIKAWKRGLKGITIFRDGCARVGVLTTKDSTEVIGDKKTLARGEVVKLDDTCIGKKRSLMTGCGTLHCEAFFDKEGSLVETYLSKGSTGGCNNFMIGLSRLISLSSRGGIGIYDVIDQLKSCGVCPSYAVRAATKRDTSKGSCCPVAVGKALLEMHNEFQQELESKNNIEEKNESSKEKSKSKKQKTVCPTCSEKLVFESGCNSCKSCGWSKCD